MMYGITGYVHACKHIHIQLVETDESIYALSSPPSPLPLPRSSLTNFQLPVSTFLGGLERGEKMQSNLAHSQAPSDCLIEK